MFRILFILSLRFFLSSTISKPPECECPNIESPHSNCSLEDAILYKLERRREILNATQQVLISRLKYIKTRIIHQTEELNKLKARSNLGSYSYESNDESFSLYQPPIGRTRRLKSAYPSSCAEANGETRTSGIYTIEVDDFSNGPFLVYCNEDVKGGGWTVIQRRINNEISFDRDMDSYKIGFGNLAGNFFIGLDKLSYMTQKPQELLIILTDFEDIEQTAKYNKFMIGNQKQNYELISLGKYTGFIGDSLSCHKGMKFSITYNKTNKITESQYPQEFKVGWWHNKCKRSSLNGLYLGQNSDIASHGIIWSSWHGREYSFKYCEMLIRPQPEEFCSSNPTYPSSCDDYFLRDSEIVTIQLPALIAGPFHVYCEQHEQDGGWLVIQRRVNGLVDFFRDWTSYKNGFGDIEGNFFIGLDKLHALTKLRSQELLVTLIDFKNKATFAYYDSFAIDDESRFYAIIELGNYNGAAEDALKKHRGMKFSTKDNDNDRDKERNCANELQGGWWYSDCGESNLNGPYREGEIEVPGLGVVWGNMSHSLKKAQMMIRPK